MDEINKIRQANLKELSLKYGSQVVLAEVLDVSPGRINHLLTGERNIGEKTARKFEQLINKPPYWFDISHTPIESTSEISTTVSMTSKLPQAPGSDLVSIDFKNIKLQAGVTGFTIEYGGETLKPMFFRVDWFVSHGFNPDKLIACKITGDSMQPKLHSGDSVVINTESVKPKDGTVFAVNYEGELVIKRMFRNNGQWYLSSDNPDKIRFPDKLCNGDYCIMIGEVVQMQSMNI